MENTLSGIDNYNINYIMFATFIYILLTAQFFAQIEPFMPYAISLTGVFASFKAMSYRAKQDKKAETIRLEKEKEKMASKIYVKDESAKLEVNILNIEKKIADYKADNIREHDQIRREVSEKLDHIIKLVS